MLAGGRKGGVKRQQKRDDLVEQKDRLLISGYIYIFLGGDLRECGIPSQRPALELAACGKVS